MTPRSEREPEAAAAPGWERVVLNAFAVLVIALMALVCLQVLASALDINPLVTFERTLPLFGDAVTINSLLDLQWHLLALIALLPAAIVWRRDAHVRVDFLYARMSERARGAVELTGHALLTAPFLALCVPAAWSFAATALASGQGSPNDGLDDLWLIKATLPLGLSLIGVALVADLPVQLRRVTGRGQ